jgi:hypothetical protein
VGILVVQVHMAGFCKYLQRICYSFLSSKWGITVLTLCLTATFCTTVVTLLPLYMGLGCPPTPPSSYTTHTLAGFEHLLVPEPSAEELAKQVLAGGEQSSADTATTTAASSQTTSRSIFNTASKLYSVPISILQALARAAGIMEMEDPVKHRSAQARAATRGAGAQVRSVLMSDPGVDIGQP